LQKKVTLYRGRLLKLSDERKSVSEFHAALKESLFDVSEMNIHRLITELETGGNIRYEEGKPQDKWFSSCVDLVRSRFNSEQMKDFAVIGINVNRVTRIHNRFLRNRFEEKLEHLVDLSDSSYKRNLEYLFLGVDPDRPQFLCEAVEEGFKSCDEYASIGMPNYVSLVNSVASAEMPRIFASKRKSQYRSENISSGKIVVCKVYLQKTQ
jgi:hypothetical protein